MLSFVNLDARGLLDKGIVLAQAAVPAPTGGLFDTSTEVFKTAALVLAAFLPLLATYFSIRKEMTKPPASQANVGSAGMAVIAGGIATAENGKLYIEQFESVVKAINKLTASQTQTAEAYELAAERWSSIIDEAAKLRRAMEEVVAIMNRKSH